VRQVQQRHHGAPAAHPDQDSISGADIIGALVCKALVGLAVAGNLLQGLIFLAFDTSASPRTRQLVGHTGLGRVRVEAADRRVKGKEGNKAADKADGHKF
jgi:hypothetical protein